MIVFNDIMKIYNKLEISSSILNTYEIVDTFLILNNKL